MHSVGAQRQHTGTAGRIENAQVAGELTSGTPRRQPPGGRCPRRYSWAWITLRAEQDADTGHHYVLIRRNDATGELAYLRCYAPHPVTLLWNADTGEAIGIPLTGHTDAVTSVAFRPNG